MKSGKWKVESLLVGLLACTVVCHGESALTPITRASYQHAEQVMALYPKPKLPGVDLSWHMDRAVDYILNDLDRERSGVPYYANRVYTGPAKLSHAKWDIPHCVGRFLNALMIWSETTGNSISDKRAVDQLRAVLFKSISEKDNLAHFDPSSSTSEVDMHSQRETLLALVGLARVRKDREAETKARQIVKGLAAEAKSPSHGANPMFGGRIIRALLQYHKLTGDPTALDLAQQYADEMIDHIYDKVGGFPSPGHNHSTLGTLTGLIAFGLYTNQSKYIDRARLVLDNGVWKVRTKYGFVFEGAGPRGEANCSADVVESDIMLGLHGRPEYFEDAERIIRNHLLASQHLDPTILKPSDKPTPKDSTTDRYTDAARRARGGFAFTLANDLIDPALSPDLDLAADLPGGAMDAFIDAWKAIVTKDEAGLRVNLLFSRDTPDLDVRSFIPAQGLVELHVKRPYDVYLRIPSYVRPADLSLTSGGKKLPVRMVGPYLLIPKQSVPTTAVITFEQVVSAQDEKIAGVEYHEQWLGDTVWNVTPLGQCVPLYQPARLALYGVEPDSAIGGPLE